MNKEYPQIDVYLYGAYMRAKGETKYNINKIQEIGTQKKLIKEYGSLEKWREKAIEEYTKEDEAWLKTKLECFQEGSELNKEYEKKIVGPMDRAYNKTMSQYSDYDSDIKPNEFYEYQKASTKNMTVEDFAILENSYYQNHEAYGSNYTQYSTNRINGNELNWAQKKLEQIVSEHAVEIKEGSTFFRKTSEAEFKALTGKSLSEFNNNAPASERTATINKVTSFGTALQYNSFVACDVIIEYTAKKGSKAFFTTNTEELEGMLAPGTKISNITVQKESAKSIPSIYTKKGRTTYDVASFKKAEYVNPSKEQEGTYDFTYRGMGRENSIMAQRRELFNGITTPVNTCVRVLVEVE